MTSLLGPRDPAQPLLTLLDGGGRVELSGSTVANWTAKTANLLADGHGSPDTVGLLLPLHWMTVCLLLGAVTSGATVVVGGTGDLVFCTADRSGQVEADDVLAVSTAPMGGRLVDLPPLVLDAGAELPTYGDRWSGPAVTPRIELAGVPVTAPQLGLSAADRVLTVLDPGTRDGLLLGLLGPLAAGAALVLCPSGPDGTGWAAEGVTASVGCELPGVRRLDAP